jgi:hypothetical protein
VSLQRGSTDEPPRPAAGQLEAGELPVGAKLANTGRGAAELLRHFGQGQHVDFHGWSISELISSFNIKNVPRS